MFVKGFWPILILLEGVLEGQNGSSWRHFSQLEAVCVCDNIPLPFIYCFSENVQGFQFFLNLSGTNRTWTRWSMLVQDTYGQRIFQDFPKGSTHWHWTSYHNGNLILFSLLWSAQITYLSNITCLIHSFILLLSFVPFNFLVLPSFPWHYNSLFVIVSSDIILSLPFFWSRFFLSFFPNTFQTNSHHNSWRYIKRLGPRRLLPCF